MIEWAKQNPRLIAYAMFGLAALIAVSSVYSCASQPPPGKGPLPVPQCQLVQMPREQDFLPVGDWCFRVPKDTPLYVRVTSEIQFVTEVSNTKVEVFGLDGRKAMERLIGYRECFRIPIQWTYLRVTPPQDTTFRIVVGQPGYQLIAC